ncbi:MAG TPA: hypothetical protein G4O16_09870 [Dehalococcoidia bacterium]|nr:hypothetical protein [Dehalococcoidia bacterium]
MTEELGKIEKPSVEEFKEGRKLYFIPLIYRGEDSPDEYIIKFNKYWEQVEKQIAELEAKLGAVKRIYHELVPAVGDDGIKAIEELCDKSCKIVRECLERGAQLEAAEGTDILTEFMDWSRCLMIGLQNPKVINQVYESYLEATKKRNEYIITRINETLQKNETGILIMRENHQLQFPTDIQIIYVAPPALDEIKRWLREQENKPKE